MVVGRIMILITTSYMTANYDAYMAHLRHIFTRPNLFSLVAHSRRLLPGGGRVRCCLCYRVRAGGVRKIVVRVWSLE